MRKADQQDRRADIRSQERAAPEVLLLQSELASIAQAFPDYDGHRLFALDAAEEQRRLRAVFKQSLTRALGELPTWAEARRDQADGDTLADYRERLLAAFSGGKANLAEILR